MSETEALTLAPEDFVFVPLGGATGIGMNCFAYGYQGKWLVVDCGIGFPDENLPGVEALLPSVDFLEQHQEDIVGLVITHAHEDHIGGVAYLWHQLHCPIYVTPFANELLRHKLTEMGLLGRAEVIVTPPGHILNLPPFEVELIAMVHSVPEPTALAIRTKAGTVLHSGDWKFETPLIGEPMDIDALKDIAKEGILAFVCDSTNVMGETQTSTESDVRDALKTLIAGYPHQQVFVTCFASNITRLESIYLAAEAAHKQVCLLGRSLWRMDAAARSTGYFDHIPEFLDEEEAVSMPKGSVVYVCTGCQGEPRSALTRLLSTKARADMVTLESDDVVIFSSREIPGNEKQIAYLQKRLKSYGVKIITTEDALVHVSGHFAGEDLKKMYMMLKPKIALPVHGDALDLLAHVEQVLKWKVPYAVALEEGQVFKLSEKDPGIIGTVPTAVLALDGKQIIPLNAKVIKNRRQMLEGRTVVLTVVLDKAQNLLGAPQVSAFGLMDEDGPEMQELLTNVRSTLDEMPLKDKENDDTLKAGLTHAVRQVVQEKYGKKTLVNIHLVRV